MKHQDDIQKRIDEAMSSVSGIQPVGVNPFLFEKIKDRMEARDEAPERTTPLIPALRIAAVCILLILNGWFIGAYGFRDAAAGGVLSDTNVEYIIDSYEIETGLTTIYN